MSREISAIRRGWAFAAELQSDLRWTGPERANEVGRCGLRSLGSHPRPRCVAAGGESKWFVLKVLRFGMVGDFWFGVLEFVLQNMGFWERFVQQILESPRKKTSRLASSGVALGVARAARIFAATWRTVAARVMPVFSLNSAEVISGLSTIARIA